MTRILEWGAQPDGAAPESAELAVLAVHGRGQDPGFMRDTADRFGPVPARFHAPEAAGNTWYPQPFRRPIEENEPSLHRSLAVIDDCVNQLGSAGFGRDRVVLWGFSQGACLLAHYVLTVAPLPCAGIILFTGGYLGTDPVPVPDGEPLNGVDVVMRSIERDPWVPPDRVEHTAALLAEAGASVDLRVDPGDEHIITDEACEAATRLLQDGRSAPRSPGAPGAAGR